MGAETYASVTGAENPTAKEEINLQQNRKQSTSREVLIVLAEGENNSNTDLKNEYEFQEKVSRKTKREKRKSMNLDDDNLKESAEVSQTEFTYDMKSLEQAEIQYQEKLAKK